MRAELEDVISFIQANSDLSHEEITKVLEEWIEFLESVCAKRKKNSL